MMKTTIKIALILGSVRENRFCDTVANWLHQALADYQGIEITLIDPAEYHLDLLASPKASKSKATLGEQLAEMDGFIVVTPEYNHSYPAPLKVLIDSFGSEWHGKPVAFVCYGGVSGGLRAVEHLRQVFAELHAMSVRDTLSFASAWEQFDENGTLANPERALRTLKRVMNQLVWWAQALTPAREARPYGDINE